MANFRQTMETQRFLRNLDEARRRYARPADHATVTLETAPTVPRLPQDEEHPAPAPRAKH